MQLYLILLTVLYLIVSFISIFKMEVIFTRILRITMNVLLLFILALTTMSFPEGNWWVFIILLLLVGSVEVIGFKILKKDLEGVNILNLMSLFIFVIYFILTVVLFQVINKTYDNIVATLYYHQITYRMPVLFY